MEGAATTVYAQGGRGNSRLVAWEGERTVTFTMEDALISPEGFMILSGAGLVEPVGSKTITEDSNFKDALFEEALPLEDLFKALRKCMKDNGEAYILYQADRFPEVYEMCKKYKLKIMKMQFVHDINSKYALRVMLKLKIGPMTKIRIFEPVMIDRGKYTKATYEAIDE